MNSFVADVRRTRYGLRVGSRRYEVWTPSCSSKESATRSRSKRSPSAAAGTLEAEGVSVVPIGGAQAIGKFLELYGPQGHDVRVAGLYDDAEEGEFRRGLDRAGLGSGLTRADMERLGFYVCVADLEDELIRALGAAKVEQVVEAHGDLGPFRTLQKQPAWKGRPAEEQLRRFMGSGGRRKIRYARFLVEALDLERVPRPLDRVLAHV